MIELKYNKLKYIGEKITKCCNGNLKFNLKKFDHTLYVFFTNPIGNLKISLSKKSNQML